jgi:hypothetical protein
MTGELVLVIAIVAAAALFLVIKALRLFRGNPPSCCSTRSHLPWRR